MAQEYKVLQFKKGDFQDAHNNYWCDMALEGFGEPVRIVVKDPMQYHDGMTLYGEVKTQTSKAGKEYNRFYREQRPETATPPSGGKPQNDQYWEDRNDAIKAQWALGRAYEKHGATKDALADATWLFENADNVVKHETGYDKFKASKPQPKEEADPEFASMLAKGMEADDIDISEIPF